MRIKTHQRLHFSTTKLHMETELCFIVEVALDALCLHTHALAIY